MTQHVTSAIVSPFLSAPVKLTLTSDGDISIEKNLTVTGNFKATADDDGNLVGNFIHKAGVVLNVQGNSTLKANDLNLYGVATVTGTTSLTGTVSFSAPGGGGMAGMMKMMAEKQKDSAFDSLFMGKLGGMMDKFGEGDPIKGGGC